MLTQEDFLSRADALAGRTVADIGRLVGAAVPDSFDSHKGWLGELVEKHLGVTAGSFAGPDTPFGIEVKTLPVDRNYLPLETTYITRLPNVAAEWGEWEHSVAFAKMRHVLYVPYLFEKGGRPGDFYFGTPLLHRLDERQSAALKADWDELRDWTLAGHRLTSSVGTWLQTRPKAATGSVREMGVDSEGLPAMVQPRGLYAKKEYTVEVLRQAGFLSEQTLKMLDEKAQRKTQ